jgi:hypothetical protein
VSIESMEEGSLYTRGSGALAGMLAETLQLVLDQLSLFSWSLPS